MQDLHYEYDPVGNIIQQIDYAQQSIYFNNNVIEPISTYKYDALYRLMYADGREQIMLAMPDHNDFPNAMQRYNREYKYDELGNILLQYTNNWTKEFVYEDNNNYLLKCDPRQSSNDYDYDPHGNIIRMPHLPHLEWDYRDELAWVANGVNKEFYCYDASGKRTRKVTDKGNITETRYYINGFELFRKTTNGHIDYEQTTINIADDEKVFVRIETRTVDSPLIRYIHICQIVGIVLYIYRKWACRQSIKF